jgi:basic membrane protein A
MKRFTLLVALAFGVILATAVAIVASPTADKNRIGLALAGPKNDRSFFQGHLIGAQRGAAKFGLKLSVVDNLTDPQAQSDALSNLARDNALVIGGGAALATPMNAVAKKFPDVTFVESAGVTKPARNVFFVVQDWSAVSYVAGVLAANLTKTKVVGFVGGALIPPTIESRAGFGAGVRSVDKTIKVKNVIVGDFSDPVKAKQAASAEIAAGADVIYSFQDAGAAGVIQAIKESGQKVLSLGVIFPKCTLPGFGPYEVGDSIGRVDSIVYNVIRDWKAGKLRSKAYGLEDATVQNFSLCPRFNSAKLKALVKKTTADIVSGKIKVPNH